MVCLPILPKRGSTVGSSRSVALHFEHAARTELGEVCRVLRIVRQFRLLLGVEMIEIAEELVEAVHGRQRLVAVADMVLAELPCGVAEVLEQAADRGIELAHAHRRAGKADLGKAAANAVLPGQERRAARGARLLAVIVQELDPLATDAVDVRRLVTHQAVRVGADIGDADIVTPDDKDIGLAARWTGRRGRCSRAAGVPGAAFCACASAPEVIAAAATSADEPSKILRRLRAPPSFSFDEVSCRPRSLVPSGMRRSFFTVRTDNHSVAAVLFTHRNPRWLVEVSIASACRAAGR